MAKPGTEDRRSILITGCSSGIGKCVALSLHDRGYRVFASVRDPGDGEAFDDARIECLALDPVTVPTYLFAGLKRVLTARMLDRLLGRVE